MKDKAKPMGNKNPAIQSMLEHLAQQSVLPNQVDLWPAVRVGLAAGKTLSKPKEISMNKHIILSASLAVLFLAFVAVWMARTVTPVSAQAVLDKAYAAQSNDVAPMHGIQHMRSEMYTNLRALPGGQGTNMTVESYHDLQTGKTRRVTIDNQTSQVQDVFSYDGAYTYSIEDQTDLPLTVYRTPQGQVADLKPFSDSDRVKSEKLMSMELFDKMRSDPNVQLNDQETWDDGRQVYVLTTQQQIKVLVNDQVERPMGATMIYFDVETYKMVGNCVVMQKDGQEIVISSQKILADETLPEGTGVAWDLSDLKGILIVDDPNRQHGDLLPEVITAQELAARTTAYLLKSVPDGYLLEISEPQRKPGSSEPYIYIASYRTAANDYFVIQAGTDQKPKPEDGIDESYTTAGGLVLHFMKDFGKKGDKQYVSAFAEAPGDVFFVITSTLSRETVKAWAEEFALVK